MKTMIDLTDRFPMKFDVERMRTELRLLENFEWVSHYDRTVTDGSWTAIPLVSRDGSVTGPDSQKVGRFGHHQRTAILHQLPYFSEIIDAFKCPLGRVRISKLPPGKIIGAHRDIGPEASNIACKQVRMHIPIITNERVTFMVGGQRLKMMPGRLYYADFTKVHSVRNDGDEARVHLIIDARVNDFLREIFPEFTLGERMESMLLSGALPTLWWSMAVKQRAGRVFWDRYEGSRVQKLRHRLRSKRQTSH
jgi:hypothetical protein